MAGGERLEALQVVWEPVDQFVLVSDGPVLRYCCDNGNHIFVCCLRFTVYGLQLITSIVRTACQHIICKPSTVNCKLKILNTDFCFDMRMGIVVDELEVLVLEVEERLDVGINLHLGEGTGLAGELETGLLEVVQIEMGVTRGVDEVTGLEACHLCYHHEEQGIGGNVEGYAEEGVGRTLVELERETVAGHVELEDSMTGRQGHLVHFGYVPGGDDHTTGVGVVLQLIEYILDLVDGTAVVVGP